MKEKKNILFKVPDTAVLLLMIVVFMAALTYIIPAGQFERVVDEATGRTIVQAGTFTYTERNPTSVLELFTSIYKGLIKSADIIAFIIVVGGAIGIVTRTNAITKGLEVLIEKNKGKENVLLFMLMLAFAICGTTFGMAPQAIPFVIILVAAAKKMGYDETVGVAIVVLGIYCGYTPGVLNPFNTGIAQEIVGLPIFSGMGIRMVLLVGSLLIAYQHTVKHGKKYKAANTLQSNNVIENDSANTMQKTTLSKTDIFILSMLFLTILALVAGVLLFDWYLEEMSALFLVMGLIAGLLHHKGNLENVMNDFINATKEMFTVIVYVGFSRAILVISEDALIMDTIVYYLSVPLSMMNNVFAAIGIYLSQGILNFFIPSSTGQAVVMMPIISPLSDLVGITRQTAVLAYQAGDGFWNMITPTHSMLMASLALAGVSFSKWFKFAFTLVLKWSLLVCALLAFAVIINWGPF